MRSQISVHVIIDREFMMLEVKGGIDAFLLRKDGIEAMIITRTFILLYFKLSVL